jgi:excinuclease UvrABC nuclease subunit
VPAEDFDDAEITSEAKLGEVLAQLEVQMREAAKKFEFERAATLRDRIRTLKQRDISGFFSAAAEPATAVDQPEK